MITHVMYAVVLFFKVDYDSCKFMSELLQSFCTAAGLEMNTEKSFR